VNVAVAAIGLIVQVIKLINRMGGVEKAMRELVKVNAAFDHLEESKTLEEKQNVAKEMSRLISGDEP